MPRLLTIVLAMTITGCSTTHYVALSEPTYNKLLLCQRPLVLPSEWAACGDEPCRRARELPLLTHNAQRHHQCADVIDDVQREADTVRAQNK